MKNFKEYVINPNLGNNKNVTKKARRLFCINNQKGLGILGAVVVSSIVGISVLTFQSDVLNSAKNLHRLKLKNAKRIVEISLELSALNFVSIKKTALHEPEVEKCISGKEKCKNKACSGEPKDCNHGQIYPISFYNSLGKEASGKNLQEGVLYTSEGEMCLDDLESSKSESSKSESSKSESSKSEFSQRCPFKVTSKIRFQCPISSSRCIQADSAEIFFNIDVYSRVQKYTKDSKVSVLIPKVSAEVENVFRSITKKAPFEYKINPDK